MTTNSNNTDTIDLDSVSADVQKRLLSVLEEKDKKIDGQQQQKRIAAPIRLV